MAVVEPSYHSGDGGANPPRRPTRVPQRCESDPIRRIVRWKSRSLNLRQLFEEKRRNPLPIKFDKVGGT